MKSRNIFSIHGDSIWISQNDWNKVAIATLREDYYDEITSVVWNMKNGYLYNRNLGYLHRYIVEKWYGHEMLEEMTRRNYVVDHLNHNKLDCEISNLEFLTRLRNTAKGMSVDIERENWAYVFALNLYKDFSTGLYQITISFNESFFLYDGETRRAIQDIFLLYNCSYVQVVQDADRMLLDYLEYKKLILSDLRFSQIKIQDRVPIKLSATEIDEIQNHGRILVERNGELFLFTGHGAWVMETPYIKGWTIEP